MLSRHINWTHFIAVSPEPLICVSSPEAALLPSLLESGLPMYRVMCARGAVCHYAACLQCNVYAGTYLSLCALRSRRCVSSGHLLVETHCRAIWLYLLLEADS